MTKMNAELMFAQTPLVFGDMSDHCDFYYSPQMVMSHLWRMQRILGRNITPKELASSSGTTIVEVKNILDEIVSFCNDIDETKNKNNYYKSYPNMKKPNFRLKFKNKQYWIELQPDMEWAKDFKPSIWPKVQSEVAKKADGVGVKVVDTRSALERLMSNV